uniref:Hes n=1 Tax=Holothuria glaberrima TaxID=31192 RepID=A0A0P0CMM7_HOLGL|nr:Hes [Holothuria glaberrima]
MPILMCKRMPTSEEFTGKMPTDSPARSKPVEGRKSSKPLMEKRRRARINDSLTQLKTLILEATNKDTSRHSKLEKADILEMTVKYLKNLQRHHIVASQDNEVNATRYRMGYSECISEVSRFLSPMDSNLVDLKVQLLNHLAQNCSAQGQNQSPQQSQNISSGHPVPTPSPAVAPAAITAHIPQPLQIQVTPSASSNNTVQTVPVAVTTQPQTAAIAVPSGTPVQMKNEQPVVPTSQQSPQNIARIVGLTARVSGGEFALVIPPDAFPMGQVPSHFIPVYSQHAPVLSPSSAAATPTVSQGLSSPVGTATASVAQLPQSIGYQTVSGCMTTTTANIPSRNMLHSNEVVMAEPKTVHPCSPAVCTSNTVSLPVQTLVTLRSPLQTSHCQNQSTAPLKAGKVKCAQEVVAMDDDRSCWRPW